MDSPDHEAVGEAQLSGVSDEQQPRLLEHVPELGAVDDQGWQRDSQLLQASQVDVLRAKAVVRAVDEQDGRRHSREEQQVPASLPERSRCEQSAAGGQQVDGQQPGQGADPGVDVQATLEQGDRRPDDAEARHVGHHHDEVERHGYGHVAEHVHE